MLFFIYGRKSVYTGKGESIENQIEMCKQYINTKFPSEQKDFVIYEDEGFSAKNTDRPQFKLMLREMKERKPDFIVCYRLDRISRKVSDFSSLIEDLNNRNISFVCIKEEFDTSKPMGKAMMYIASVFAQLERETIAERVRDNMILLARTGRWLGGTPPTGYLSDKQQEVFIDGKVKTSCCLKENPNEIYIIDIIFEKFLELQSVSGVNKFLMSKGIKSRSGKFFSLLGIKEILQNPVYCVADKDALTYFKLQNSDVCFEEKDCTNKYGLLSYNKRDYTKRHTPRQPMDKWIIAIGKHHGRISGQNWVSVQNIIKNNIPTGKTPSKIHNRYSLLSGLIYCEKCESRLFAKPRTGKNTNSEVYDYICNNKLRGGKMLCDCQNLGGLQTDDIVCEYLLQYINEDSNIHHLLDKLKKSLKETENQNQASTIEANIKKYNEEINNLVNSLSTGKLTASIIVRVNEKLLELEQKINQLLLQKEKMKEEQTTINDRESQLDMIANALSSFKDNFNILTVQEKRILIKFMVKKIVWDGKNLHIFMDDE